MRALSGLVRVVSAVLAVLAMAWVPPQTWAAEVPLPQLPPDGVQLRVAHVVNPRLPRMTPAQLQILLAATARTAQAHWGLTLRFTEPVEVPIATVFATIPAERHRLAARQRFDFKSGRGDTPRLAKAFGRGFRSSGEALAPMVAYATEATAGDTVTIGRESFESFGASMARLQLARLAPWRARTGLDGAPVLDASPYNEYTEWIALGYGELPFELVITNQPVVSVEYVDPAVHTALRGGYTNGITSYGRRSRFGTFSMWSTYAFTGNDDALVQLRTGERYTPEEAAELAGISATHELGHQLFHLLHPFGQPACVMNPVPLFAYRAWARQLSAPDCPLRSSPTMTPGAYKFVY